MKLKIALLTLFLTLVYCTKDEPITFDPDPEPEPTSYVLEGQIKENKILDASQIWTLKGRVSVVDGVTLTIPAGTIIKGESGTGADASTLIIARGGKIDAQGTSQKPIIFTSIADNIQVGGIYPSNTPALGIDVRGLWGGVLILGKAPVSFNNDLTEAQIEGIPVSDINGLYGGSIPTDNSGIFKYVSIRHGGAEIGEGNEINGLTLGGVGSGTTLDNVEVVANVDDGIEFFGGMVNATNLLVWGQGDDGLDIDQAYAGTIDNALVVLTAASDHGLEIDGPEGNLEGSFTIKNTTIVGASDGCTALSADGEIADFRSNAMGTTDGILAKGFAEGKDVELDNDGVALNYTNGKLVFKNWNFLPNELCATEALEGGIFDDKSDIGSSFETDANTFAKIVTTPDVGANESVFSWTFYKR